jgi:hypothetical protein
MTLRLVGELNATLSWLNEENRRAKPVREAREAFRAALKAWIVADEQRRADPLDDVAIYASVRAWDVVEEAAVLFAQRQLHFRAFQRGEIYRLDWEDDHGTK